MTCPIYSVTPESCAEARELGYCAEECLDASREVEAVFPQQGGYGPRRVNGCDRQHLGGDAWRIDAGYVHCRLYRTGGDRWLARHDDGRVVLSPSLERACRFAPGYCPVCSSDGPTWRDLCPTCNSWLEF